jgi:hypothetical protein
VVTACEELRAHVREHLIAMPPHARHPIAIALILFGAALVGVYASGAVELFSERLTYWEIYGVLSLDALLGAFFVCLGLSVIFPDKLIKTKLSNTQRDSTSDRAPQPESACGDHNLIAIQQLPADVVEAITPFLPAGTVRIRGELLHAFVDEAVQLLAERERYARQEAITLDWQNEYKLAEARAA